MSKQSDMLGGSALANLAGPLKNLIDNLCGSKGKFWLAELKKLLRGERDSAEIVRDRCLQAFDLLKKIERDITAEIEPDDGQANHLPHCLCNSKGKDCYEKLGLILERHGVDLAKLVGLGLEYGMCTKLALVDGKLMLQYKKDGGNAWRSCPKFSRILEVAVTCSDRVILLPDEQPSTVA